MVLNINGVKHEVTVDPDVALLTVLRDYLWLTGSKYGCGEGACGACPVLINGKPSRSCIAPVNSVANKEGPLLKVSKQMETSMQCRRPFFQLSFNTFYSTISISQ